MPEQHALLSASGAHRWMNCTPSAVLESGLAASASDAAQQGTAAHALAEHKLRRALHQHPNMRPASEYIDAEMEGYTDDYVDFILEQIRDARQSCPDPQALIEQRLDFSHIVPGGFGTGDAVIIAEPRLHIIDLKYGMGVLVEAEQNPQLMLYALGALHAFESLYEITEVAVMIFQPRRGNVSTWTTTTEELLAWAQTEVAPKAALASTGDGQFSAGSWCQFCKLASTCRARAEANLDIAKYEFAPPAELSDNEIADVLERLPLLTKWASDVETYAASLAINQGKQWPGFKVVAGRSVRKYTDEAAVAEAAQAAGFTDIYDKKLITRTAIHTRTKTKHRDRGLTFSVESGIMFIALPSGRRLAYVQPSIGENQCGNPSINYWGVGANKKWQVLETYGGKLVENTVQAIARDLLTYALHTLDDSGH